MTFGAGVLTAGVLTAGVLPAACCVGATAGAWPAEVCPPWLAGVVLVCGWDCAEGAGSGDGAGVLAGACCGLGPEAYAGAVVSAAAAATITAVKLIPDHRAMTHGNGRC